uniref:BTB/POZ domain-containing protein NPY2 n=1 Tax=Tanacetum cinerariifolium TaxID=118510 RepID=A0A699GQ00_TANCI|nr:BTB/POZ domain-containing protein NPY2 [Tanacetum cinerariifolium]
MNEKADANSIEPNANMVRESSSKEKSNHKNKGKNGGSGQKHSMDGKNDYTQQKKYYNFKKVYHCWVCRKPMHKAKDFCHKKEHEEAHLQFKKDVCIIPTNVHGEQHRFKDWKKRKSHAQADFWKGSCTLKRYVEGDLTFMGCIDYESLVGCGYGGGGGKIHDDLLVRKTRWMTQY